MNDGPPTVAELAEYCRLQAGLLAGHVETMREEATALLDEADAELDAAKERLDAADEDPATPASPETPTGADGVDLGVGDEVAEKQALVEAKQARMAAFTDLADGYTDLADALETESEDAADALERVVRFEAEADAPAYFDRETLFETVAGDDRARD